MKSFQKTRRGLTISGKLLMGLTVWAILTAGNACQAEVLDIQIDDDSDDAEEFYDLIMDLYSSDLELVNDGGHGNQKIGVRFTNAVIASGTRIESAYVQFTCKDTLDEVNGTLTIQAEDIGDAPAFTAISTNISSRELTTASVSWSPEGWSADESTVDERTPDLASLVQEVVDRQDWSSGNALAIIIEGTGRRCAWAHDGNPSGAPRLHVEWTTTLPRVDNADGATNVTSDSAWLNGILISTGTAATTVSVFWGQSDGHTNESLWEYSNSFGECSVSTLSTNVVIAPNSVYFYRFHAVNVNGRSWANKSARFVSGPGFTLAIQGSPDEYGRPVDLDYGSHTVRVSTVITNGVTATAYDTNGVLRRCVGWTGSGSAPTEGLSNSVAFTFMTNSTLNWHWEILQPRLSFWTPSAVERFQLVSCETNLEGTVKKDFSGCAILPSTEQTLVILNDPPLIHVYDSDWAYVRSIPLSGFLDTEGICQYEPDKGLFAVSEEDRADITILSITSNTTSITKSSGRTIDMGLTFSMPNKGIEGITYDPIEGRFYAVKEKNDMRIYKVEYDGGTVAEELFDATEGFGGRCTDFSDVILDSETRHLFVLSQESRRIVECDLAGNVLSTLDLAAPRPEGITLSTDGRKMWIISESNEGYLYDHVAPATNIVEGMRLDLPVRMSWSYTNIVTVDYCITSTNATADIDFAPATGTLVFPPGIQTQVLSIAILSDGSGEETEEITVVLTNCINATFSRDSAYRCAIVDDGQLAFTVVSPHGSPAPDAGRHVYDNGSVLTNVVSAPDESGTTQYVCEGWSLAGNVDENGDISGSGNEVVLTLTNEAVLTWNWATNYWLEIQAGPGGSVQNTSAWHVAGSGVVVTAVPNEQFVFGGWSGDLEALDDPNSATATVTMISAVNVSANFEAIEQTNMDIRVDAGNDDAEELEDGSMYITSTDLELVYDGTRGTQIVGLRFTNAVIPQVATILNAHIQFTCKDTLNETPCFLTIKGQASDNALAFDTSLTNISGRTRTEALVQWTPSAWTAGGCSNEEQTPDLSPILQEIVDRPGWLEGNAIVLIIEGTGQRRAWSCEGSSSNAPLLHVEWDAALPRVDNGDGASNIMPESADLNGTVVCTGKSATAVTVYWGTADGGTNKIGWAFTNSFGVVAPGPLVTNVTLAPNTPYYYRFHAANAGGEKWAEDSAEFRTGPGYSLVVNSRHGTGIPEAGTYTNDYGTILTNTMTGVEETGTTQYVCAGWTLTGNEPLSGTATNFTMTLTNDCTLTWNWGTNYWLDLIEGANGSLDAISDWYADGTTIVVNALADDGCHFARWTGDTNGCTLVGGEITIPMTEAREIGAAFAINMYDITASALTNGSITPCGVVQVKHGSDTNFVITADEHYHVSDVDVDGVWIGATNEYTFSNVTTNHAISVTFAIDRKTLTVVSDHGSPEPAVGPHDYDYGTILSNSISAPDESGTTQYVCEGWSLAGNVDENGDMSGSGNEVVLTLTNEAVLTWNWATNYWLEIQAGPGGSVQNTSAWHVAGSGVVVTATHDIGWHFAGWTGNVEPTNANCNPLTLVVWGPLYILANFEVDMHGITVVAGNNGTIWPTGTIEVAYGGQTNFSIVASPYYHISDIRTNAVSVSGPFGITNFVYTWSNITETGLFEASFSENLATNNTPEWWLAGHYPGETDFDLSALSDSDEDGAKAWQEYIAGTIPTNCLSCFRIVQCTIGENCQTSLILWESMTSRTYTVFSTTNLMTGVWTNVCETAGDGSMKCYEHIGTNDIIRFFEIRVERN